MSKITKEEKEFLKECKSHYKKEINVSDEELLGIFWREWENGESSVEISPFDSKSGRPELIDLPEEWVTRYQEECQKIGFF